MEYSLIIQRIKNIIQQLVEIFGHWSGKMANKARFIEDLVLIFIRGFQQSLSNERLIALAGGSI